MTTTTKPLPFVKVTFGRRDGNFICRLERVVDNVTDVGRLVQTLQLAPWVACAVRENNRVIVSYTTDHCKQSVRRRLNEMLKPFEAQVHLAK